MLNYIFVAAVNAHQFEVTEKENNFRMAGKPRPQAGNMFNLWKKTDIIPSCPHSRRDIKSNLRSAFE